MSSSATATVPRRRRTSTAGAVLPRVDGRLRGARRFKELAEVFAREFGGNLSPADQSQVAQLVTLVVLGEQMSADVAGGRPVDFDGLIRINSETRRLTEALRAKTGKGKNDRGASPLAQILAGG